MTTTSTIDLTTQGYVKIGPNPGATSRADETARIQSVSRALSKGSDCDIRIEDGITWMRNNARKRGNSVPPLLNEFACIGRQDMPNAELFGRLETDYKKTRYYSAERHVISLNQVRQFVSSFEQETREWKALHQLSMAISLCNPDDLAATLQLALTALFQRFPETRVLIFTTDFAYESRLAGIRGGYSLSQYPFQEWTNGFASLRQWHTISTVNQPQVIFNLGSLAFYPQVPFFQTGPLGLRLIFVFESPMKIETQEFPESWLSFTESRTDFADEARSHADILENPNGDVANRSAHARYQCARQFSSTDMIAFIRWLTSQYNELFFRLAEPGEFLTDDFVDFVKAVEIPLSIDRFLRKACACVASNQNHARKSTTMELADLIESVRRVFTPIQTGDWFKFLWNPLQGKNALIACFRNLPQPFLDHFTHETELIYQELVDVIQRSITIRSKMTTGGIYVRDRRLATENMETWPEFIGNVMRALRNSHHGYLTESDPSARPSRYLALVTGDTPDSLSHLGIIWTLGLLASPQDLIAWNWQAVSAWD